MTPNARKHAKPLDKLQRGKKCGLIVGLALGESQQLIKGNLSMPQKPFPIRKVKEYAGCMRSNRQKKGCNKWPVKLSHGRTDPEMSEGRKGKVPFGIVPLQRLRYCPLDFRQPLRLEVPLRAYEPLDCSRKYYTRSTCLQCIVLSSVFCIIYKHL